MLDIGTDITEDTNNNNVKEIKIDNVEQPTQVQKLVTFYNPSPNEQETEDRVLRPGTTQERLSTILDTTTHEMCFLNRGKKEEYISTNFKEAWWHPYINERNK